MQSSQFHVNKSDLNQTKAIDQVAEDLIVEALSQKFTKLTGVKAYTVFSEELGIKTFPEGAHEDEADLVVFIDPIDGTEFVESLRAAGHCWPYDRRIGDVICAVAGDIFLDRVLLGVAGRVPGMPGFHHPLLVPVGRRQGPEIQPGGRPV